MIQYFGIIERDLVSHVLVLFHMEPFFFLFSFFIIIALQRIFVKKTNFTSSFHDCDWEAMDTQTT